MTAGARPEAEPASEARGPRLLALASVAAAVVPLVVATVRAIRQGWVPVGDSAVIAIRSRDVLSSHPPRLGLWASTSWELGLDVNHPGPLLFDLLAVPARLTGSPAGLLLGVMAVNVASVVGIAVVAARRGGTPLVLLSMAVTTVLCWSMGSEVLIEPWHASTVLLPFLLLIMLSWSVLDGDWPCLPWVVGVGSLIIETNLGYAVLVPGLWLWVGGSLAWRRWRGGGGDLGRSFRRWALVALVVGVVCWAQPLVEQVAGDGEGNVSRLVEASGKRVDSAGLTDGLRGLGNVVALPPFWLRPSYAEAYAFGATGNPLPSLAAAAAALVVLALALGWAQRTASRLGRRTEAHAARLGLVLLVLGVASAVRMPTVAAGTVAYQARWMWPLAAFATLALVLAVSSIVTARRSERAGAAQPVPLPTWWSVGLIGITLVAAIANLPSSDQGSTAPWSTAKVAREMTSQLRTAPIQGPVVVRCSEGVFDPYCEAVMALLQRRGIEFNLQPVKKGRVGQPDRQYGAHRVEDGRSATLIEVVAGESALFERPELRKLAAVTGLPLEERQELFFLKPEVARDLQAGRLRLNDRGREAARFGTFASIDPGDDLAHVDPDELLGQRRELWGEFRRDAAILVHEGLVEATTPEAMAHLRRYVELQDRLDVDTVAVFASPVTDGG